MGAPTLGKRERLPRILLSMRVGHLFDATREERAELLRGVCEKQDLEGCLEELYERVISVSSISKRSGKPSVPSFKRSYQATDLQRADERGIDFINRNNVE